MNVAITALFGLPKSLNVNVNVPDWVEVAIKSELCRTLESPVRLTVKLGLVGGVRVVPKFATCAAPTSTSFAAVVVGRELVTTDAPLSASPLAT